MSVVLVQTVKAATVSTSSMTVSPSSTGSGSMLTVGITVPAADSVSGVTDNQSNTYTLRLTVANSTIRTYWYDCLGSSGGVTSVTATFGSTSNAALIFQERTGVSGSFDVGVTNSGTSTTASAGPTSTTSVANELVICFAGATLPPMENAGTGYGNIYYEAGPSCSFSVEDKQVSSIGTQSGTMTVGAPIGAVPWVCGIATYGTSSSSITINAQLLGSTSEILDATPETPGTYYVPLVGSTSAILDATAQIGATQSVGLLVSGSGVFHATAQIGATVNVPLLGSASDVFKFASGQGAIYVSVASLESTSQSYDASVLGNVSVSVQCLGSTSGILRASFESAPNAIVNVKLLGSTTAILPAIANIGPTVQVGLIGSRSGSFPATASVGVTIPVAILGSGSGVFHASAGAGHTVTVGLIASTTAILDAAAQSGVVVNVKSLGSSSGVFSASAHVGITASPRILGSTSGIFEASVSRGVALPLSLLHSGSGILDALPQVGVTASVESLASTTRIYDSSLSIPVALSLDLLSGTTTILLPSAYGGSVYLQVQCLQSTTAILDAAFSSVTAWNLSIRQQIQYLGLAQVYRKTRNLLGDPVWFVVISDMPCYLYTTPNMDQPSQVSQVKESNVFTDDRLAYPVQADIRAGDKVYYQGPTAYQPPSPDTGSWFSVMGQARSRPSSGLRMANKGEVYLNPDSAPALQGVA